MEERLKRHYTSRYKGRFYDLAMKMYFEEGIPIKRISKELSVSRMSIYRWIRIFENGNCDYSMGKNSSTHASEDEKSMSASVETGSPDTTRKLSDEEAAAEIALLKRKLREADLREDFYDEMINVAESRFKISIRKKTGAKR